MTALTWLRMVYKSVALGHMVDLQLSKIRLDGQMLKLIPRFLRSILPILFSPDNLVVLMCLLRNPPTPNFLETENYIRSSMYMYTDEISPLHRP